MFRTIVTLMRGAAHTAEQNFVDQHALVLLDQQIRDGAAAVERAKRALAVAMAHKEAEEGRLETVGGQIADLEERAVAALKGGREDLASEAAETLAGLEADREAIAAGIAHMRGETERLRKVVAASSRRLAELNRGKRTAAAGEAVRRLQAQGATASDACGGSGLADAEATLRRLRERQAEDAAADRAFAELDLETRPQSVAEKLEQSGFGKPTRATPAAIMDLLKAKAGGSTASPAADAPKP